jgi:hypothetical protein
MERLEDRRMLTGTWTPLINMPSGGLDVALLLSNGTIMAHGGGSEWDQLTPDSNGSFVNGMWSQLASMNHMRGAFTSDVLPNGDIFVLGGEYYDGNGPVFNTKSGEIYDTFSQTPQWTEIPYDDPQSFSDDPSEVILPDGDILCGETGKGDITH